MGLIDTIKPLSIVLSSAIKKYHPHLEENSLECRELKLALLGAKRECNPLCYAEPIAQVGLFSRNKKKSQLERQEAG